MILTKILFAVLILVCAAFYILYLWDFALVLLIVMIALPIIMFITTIITQKMINVEFAVKDKNVSKNISFPVQLVVNNRSIFPIGKAEAHIEYYNVFSDEISSFELYLPIQARNSQRVTFQLSSKFCGIVRIRCSYLHIYDPLRIFKFKAGKSISTEIIISPEGHEIDGLVHYTDRVNEESDVFSEYKAGDDPSEVFDLREYNQGDKLNRIHWKLSSKKDEFIVKEYSLPIDVPCSILVDLKCYKGGSLNLPVYDTIIETFLSLSQFLLDNERAHSIIYYNSNKERFVERDIKDSQDLAATAYEMVSSVGNSTACVKPTSYLSENLPLSFASFTLISSFPDSSVLEYIDENVDADFKNAMITISSSEDLESAGAEYSSLNIIPVVIGRISASIKDLDV